MGFLSVYGTLRISESIEVTFHKFNRQHRLLLKCGQVRIVTAE